MEETYNELKEMIIEGNKSEETMINIVEDAYAKKKISTLRYHELIIFITKE